MKRYSSYIPEIIKENNITSFDGSILVIQIKNLNQILALSGNTEIENLLDNIFEIVSKLLPKNKFKCFYNDKNFSWIIEGISISDLENLSYKIHESLTVDTSQNYSLNIRIVYSDRIAKDNIYNALMVMNDFFELNEEVQNIASIYDINHRIKQFAYEHEALKELKDALKNNSLCFAFQPVIECKTGNVAYHECLLRLSNDDYKLISAGPYIMLAEKYGLINSIDKYVFDMAVKELKHSDNISVSVNISNIGIQDKILAEHIKTIVSEAGIGHRMTVEITETALNKDYENTKNFVMSMKSLGCKIALDDFGVGYTSFNQLKHLPIDVIKIDGCFIRDIDVNHKNSAIVDLIIKTAEELGCKTVAEFVEKGSIAKKLIELNIDYMQGNFFSPAVNYRSWSMK